MTDITKTTEPRSDQLNFDDVMLHEITATIIDVKVIPGSDQPVELHLDGFPGRPYKPGLSMRRVLIAAWGPEASKYIGRRVQLYGDPTIRFGKEPVGGIRIRALSDLPEPLEVRLTLTRGKRAPFIVQPLTTDDTTGRDWLAELELAGDDIESVTALGKAAGDAHAPAEVLEALRAKFRSLASDKHPDYIAEETER